MPDSEPTVLRRRGRPQRLPFDASPSHLPAIDATRRIAWLLATTRLLAPTTSGMGRTAFAEHLRAGGIVVDTTRLSRWESGSVVAPQRLLTAYEALTGVPAGSLLAASLMSHRHAVQSIGSAATAVAKPEPNHATQQTSDDLDAIFDRVDSRTADGGDWLTLATEINRFDRVYLHPASWAALCSQLVSELARSGGVAFLRRYEAAAVLMRHPAGRRHLGRSLGAFVMHPHVQNAAPALALLSEVGDGAAGDLVVRLLSEPNDVVRRGAMGVAAAMAARGQLPLSSERLLETVAGRELSKGNPSRRAAAFELAAQLSEPGYERLMAATGDERSRQHITLARTTHELVSSEVARTTAESVASHAESVLRRGAHDPDPMLRKLVREGLFHARRDRRHLAAALLAASQYAAPVAEAALGVTREHNDVVAAMAWSMLRRLSTTLERSHVSGHVPRARPGLQVRGLVTLGLARGDLSDYSADYLLAIATRDATTPAVRHAAIFALGMSGHEHVRTISTDLAATGRDAAAWWLAIGGSLHDADAATLTSS